MAADSDLTNGRVNPIVNPQTTWFGETEFDANHPSQLIADIAQAYEETTSDVSILLDALWSKDLNLVDAEWREVQARNLEAEAERIALLLRNAARIVRTLTFNSKEEGG